MHNIIYQILTRNQQLACRLYVQRIINKKNLLLPNSQGARGNGNRRMSEDNAKEEQGLHFTFACFSIKSTVWRAVLVRAKIIPSC